MGTADAALPRYLAEWYADGLGEQTMADAIARLRHSTSMMPVHTHRTALIYAAYVPQENYAFMVFDADSADRVSLACQEAGFPADRVTAALEAPPASH